jgi:hypothetical protein
MLRGAFSFQEKAQPAGPQPGTSGQRGASGACGGSRLRPQQHRCACQFLRARKKRLGWPSME